MKRQLTDEQKAKADARRAQFKALAQRLASLTQDQRTALAEKMVGVVTVEGHALSVHNACLIAAQRPDATLIGGFNQWRAHGRTVRKGEHGMMIWAPAHHGNGTAPADSQLGQDPQPSELSDQGPRFITVTVFDVAQTEAA